MNGEYQNLKVLQGSNGYKILEELWAIQGKKIMDAFQKATRERSKDESLRWHAGQWQGFDLAVGMLARALADMEREDQNLNSDRDAEKILKELDEIGGKRK